MRMKKLMKRIEKLFNNYNPLICIYLQSGSGIGQLYRGAAAVRRILEAVFLNLPLPTYCGYR